MGRMAPDTASTEINQQATLNRGSVPDLPHAVALCRRHHLKPIVHYRSCNLRIYDRATSGHIDASQSITSVSRSI